MATKSKPWTHLQRGVKSNWLVLSLVASASLGGTVCLFFVSLWWGFAALLVLAFLITAAVLLLLKSYELAAENVLFTFVKEGTAKAIMRGGEFVRMVMEFENFHLNDPLQNFYNPSKPDWQVIYHGAKTDHDGNLIPGHERDVLHSDGFYDRRPWILKLVGLHWVGIPPVASVYTYRFKWKEISTGEDGRPCIRPRDEDTDYINISDFTYGLYSGEAQTEDGVTVEIIHVDTVAVRNPYHALFVGRDWLSRAEAVTGREARNHIGKRSFFQLRSETNETDEEKRREDSFSLPILALNARLPDEDRPPFGLEGRYGITIRSADMFELRFEGSERLKAAFTAQIVATEEARAAKTAAEGEAVATRTRGQAEADVVVMDATARATAKVLDGRAEARNLLARLRVMRTEPAAAQLLAQLDALTEASKGAGTTMVWAQNPLIKQVGGLSSLLEAAGVKSVSELKDFLTASNLNEG